MKLFACVLIGGWFIENERNTLILQRLTPPLFAALFFQLKLDSQSSWDVAQTDEHFNLFIWQLIRMKDIFETDWSECFFCGGHD